jgi:2-polyprenyl-3-methyl-5-hydroxy-6-metoxy-1,4-benzoquinol methylase
MLNRLTNSTVNLVKHPVDSIKTMWEKNRRLFDYEKLVEPPNIQHGMINENLVLSLVEGKRILDCGCGNGRWGYLLNKKGFMVEGFDISPLRINESQKLNVYNNLYVLDAEEKLPFENNSFDTVLAVELLEHLAKSKAYYFLDELKRIAHIKVILSTPEGFYKSNSGTTFAEIHKSGWEVSELENLGFEVTVNSSRIYKWILATYRKNALL